MDCSMPGFPIPHRLLKFAQVHVHCVGDAIQPSHPLSHSSPSALNPSRHQGLFQLAVYIRWPKYWSFSFSIGPSNEYAELSSLKIDCFDLLAVQGTHKSLLQHCSSKASNLWSSAFFMVQLWRPYMTTGKSIALTIQTFIGKAAYEDINLRITCTLVCSSTVHNIGRTTSYLITGKFLNLSLLPFLHLSKDRKIALPLAVWER